MKTKNQLNGARDLKTVTAFIVSLALLFSLIPMSPAGQVYAEGESGEDPPPGPDPIEISFTINSTEGGISTSSAALYSFNKNSDRHIISCPAITEGSIVFPKEISGSALTLTGISLDPMGTTSDSITITNGAVTGSAATNSADNTFSFTQPFKRITLAAELEGEQRTYYFTFYQPGYNEMSVSFVLDGTDMDGKAVNQTTTRAIDHSLSANDHEPLLPIEIPLNTSSASITASGILSESGILVDDIGGAPLEYVVDREDQVKSQNGVLTFHKGFGKVKVHYQYIVGNSWEGFFVEFYEPDFVGIDVRYDINAGDYGQTSVVNVTSGVAIKPTSYVYFLNESIQLWPYDMGKTCTITAISGAGIVSEEKSQGAESYWQVTLPAITEPEVTLTLTLDVEDDGSREVDLLVKRVLIMSTSYDFRGKVEDYFDDLQTNYQTPIVTAAGVNNNNGYGDFQTFLTVFGFTPDSPEEEAYQEFPIDHTLLVLYYEDDQILGSREIKVDCLNTKNELDRMEVLVYREGDPTYADVASANRITAFVISKEGALDDSFHGATYGVGAGWGHLLPYHDDYGTGKDGMEQ